MALTSPTATGDKNTCMPTLICSRPVPVDVTPIDNNLANMDISGDGQNGKEPNGDKNALNLDFNQNKKMGSDEDGSNTFQPCKNDRIMNDTEKLINLLKSIAPSKSSYTEFCRRTYLIDEFFEMIFEMKKTETEFSLTDKNIIGPLIADLLLMFGLFVSHSAGNIDEYNLESYKILRSGLEFFLEEFQNFPDGNNGTLEFALKDFRITEDIETLDNVFNIVNYSSYTEMSLLISNKSTMNTQGIEHIPLSHWWWWC